MTHLKREVCGFERCAIGATHSQANMTMHTEISQGGSLEAIAFTRELSLCRIRREASPPYT